MLGFKRGPKVVEVMPNGFTFEEAIAETSYLASLGKTGIDAAVEIAPRTYIVQAVEGERIEVIHG